ncbi:extensin family protein [Pseudonocardia kunmingensis]|nr:extensin family protein [Pseudonocardia kunmingensis]
MGPARSALTPSSSSFTPGRYDVQAQAKQAAADFVERVGTWRSSEPDAPSARLTAAGYPAELMATAAPLLDSAAHEATTTLIYPQYGGLTDRAASVMVLARQELHIDSRDRVRDVLLDVRMARTADGTWQVTPTIDPARPQIAAPRAGGPSPLGRTILEDPAVLIPEPGRADITDRRANDPILAVLARLADTYTLDVQVIVSGHPGTVFPSTHLSNHAVGRAVDVRAVDGRPVSSIPRDDPLLSEFMIAAGRAGATEVGGPIVPSGRGYFSDDVHQDHFHLGITPTEQPAVPPGRSG